LARARVTALMATGFRGLPLALVRIWSRGRMANVQQVIEA
jgi:hypothetical protein